MSTQVPSERVRLSFDFDLVPTLDVGTVEQVANLTVLLLRALNAEGVFPTLYTVSEVPS